MAVPAQILQSNDVVWTIGKSGQLRGWKCMANTGQMVEMATHEIEAVMRTKNTDHIYPIQ